MKTLISIEEAHQRALVAIDEIYFCAKQLAGHLGITTSYEEAMAVFSNITCRVDDMPMDIENIRDDADPE